MKEKMKKSRLFYTSLKLTAATLAMPVLGYFAATKGAEAVLQHELESRVGEYHSRIIENLDRSNHFYALKLLTSDKKESKLCGSLMKSNEIGHTLFLSYIAGTSLENLAKGIKTADFLNSLKYDNGKNRIFHEEICFFIDVGGNLEDAKKLAKLKTDNGDYLLENDNFFQAIKYNVSYEKIKRCKNRDEFNALVRKGRVNKFANLKAK